RGYKLDEGEILDNFKTNIGKGIEALSSTKQSLVNSEKELDKHSSIVGEIKTFDKNFDRKSLAVSIIDLPTSSDISHHLKLERNQVLENYIESELKKPKYDFSNKDPKLHNSYKEKGLDPIHEIPKNAIKNQQLFFKETYEKLQDTPRDLSQYDNNVSYLIAGGRDISNNPEIVDKLLNYYDYIANESSVGNQQFVEVIHSKVNINKLLEHAEQRYARIAVRNVDNEYQTIKWQKSIAIKDIIAAIDKQQNTLAMFDGKVSDGWAKFKLEELRLAYNYVKDKKIDELKNVTEDLVKFGLKTEEEIIKKFKTTKLIYGIHHELDTEHKSYQITTQLKQFDERVTNSKTLEAAIEILKEKSEYLDNVDSKITNADAKKEWRQQIDDAKRDLKSNQLLKLTEVCSQAIGSKLYKQDNLLNIFTSTKSIKEATNKVGFAMEHNYIQKNLAAFAKIKQNAKDVGEVVKIIAKEESFLKGLNNNLNYPDMHSPEMHALIKTATTSISNNHNKQLEQALGRILNSTHTQNEAIKAISSANTSTDAYGAIVDSHQRTIIDAINRNGEILERNGHVHCEQKDFTCPVKLLEHCIDSLSKSPAKQYHPLKQLREAHHKAQQEQQRQLERSKDFGISL
ncbi:MAG: hypothetical protein GY694_03430, partial [Gammaproteobacteria bacterium]|nr:hypothetical protein [Gammaproteobacteria bacterium]